MKKVGYCILTAGLVLVAGCSKETEDGTKELMTTEELAEKTQETAIQATEKAAAVTTKIEETTKEVSQKTQEAVTTLTVKAEEVMGD
ncbi:MAG: hypothetical protein OEL75_01985, partial [Kiritimatiellaceae bacterium]|nr:hypothetical protein [Kiritimatiellaceae bacterium]